LTSAKAKYLTTPVTKIDGEIVLGFDEKRVVALLDVQRLGESHGIALTEGSKRLVPA